MTPRHLSNPAHPATAPRTQEFSSPTVHRRPPRPLPAPHALNPYRVSGIIPLGFVHIAPLARRASFMTETFSSLAEALAAHHIELPAPQVERLEQYARMLWEWNEKINLTRHTTFEKFVSRDIVDAQALAGLLGQGEVVLDVGTGGGLPGMILAILRPDVRMVLCEAIGKKARAVAEMVQRLNLPVPVVQARAEDLLGPAQFNTLILRAVGRLRVILRWFQPHWEHFDRVLVVKGPSWVQERGEARHYGLMKDLALRKLLSYPLAGAGSESVILQICPKERLLDRKTCKIRSL